MAGAGMGTNGGAEGAGFVTQEAPFVLQCRKCNAIVGDSFAFQAADDELHTIVLHTACNVSLQPNSLMTSKKGIDLGSTYTMVSCSDCSAVLGRHYRTTPRHLDHLRDVFSFDIDSTRSYSLGSAPPAEPGSSAVILPSIQTMQQMEEKLIKMQHLLLLFNERLSNIERSSIANDPSPKEDSQAYADPDHENIRFASPSSATAPSKAQQIPTVASTTTTTTPSTSATRGQVQTPTVTTPASTTTTTSTTSNAARKAAPASSKATPGSSTPTASSTKRDSNGATRSGAAVTPGSGAGDSGPDGKRRRTDGTAASTSSTTASSPSNQQPTAKSAQTRSGGQKPLVV